MDADGFPTGADVVTKTATAKTLEVQQRARLCRSSTDELPRDYAEGRAMSIAKRASGLFGAGEPTCRETGQAETGVWQARLDLLPSHPILKLQKSCNQWLIPAISGGD